MQKDDTLMSGGTKHTQHKQLTRRIDRNGLMDGVGGVGGAVQGGHDCNFL